MGTKVLADGTRIDTDTGQVIQSAVPSDSFKVTSSSSGYNLYSDGNWYDKSGRLITQNDVSKSTWSSLNKAYGYAQSDYGSDFSKAPSAPKTSTSTSTSTSGGQTVTVEKDGVRTTVVETTPGLFGKLGYTYVSGGSSTPTTSQPTGTTTQNQTDSGRTTGYSYQSATKGIIPEDVVSGAPQEQTVQGQPNAQMPQPGFAQGGAGGFQGSAGGQAGGGSVSGQPNQQGGQLNLATPLSNPSVVDFLAATGQPTDFASRSKLAENFGIGNYTGTASQNAQLLRKLREGQPGQITSPADTGAVMQSEQINPTPDMQVMHEGNVNTFGLTATLPDFLSQPIPTIQEIVTQVFGSMGLGEANKEYESISKELEKLENKRDKEIRDINDNPWLTEGVRLRQVQKAEEKWSDEINNRVNRLQLLDNVRDDARQQAQFALGTAVSIWDSNRTFQANQIQQYYDQVQQQFENQIKLQALNAPEPGTSDMQEYMFAVENGQFDGSFLQFKQAMAAATRAPSSGGGIGGDNPQLYAGLSSATATAVRSKVGKFASEPIVQNFATIQEGYNFSQAINSNTTNPADDQALIYSLAKTLDPDSVVREGEYATAQKYAQSWVKAYGKGVTQAINGTGFLSVEARDNIKKVIETKYNSSAISYNNLQNQYVQGINSLTGRGDGSAFLVDYATQPQQSVYGPVQAQPQTVFDEVVSTPTASSGGFFSNFLSGLFGQ